MNRKQNTKLRLPAVLVVAIVTGGRSAIAFGADGGASLADAGVRDAGDAADGGDEWSDSTCGGGGSKRRTGDAATAFVGAGCC